MLIAILLVILLIISSIYLVATVRRPSNFPPGPPWIPIVGNSLLVKKLSKLHGGFHKALICIACQYNTQILGLKLGSESFVVVFSKELIKQVFTQDEFQGRPDSYFIRLRTMGTRKGITMTDGHLWQEQRHFAVRHLRNLGFGKVQMESLIAEELKDLLELFGPGGDLTITERLPRAVLNVLWAVVAGSRFSPTDPQLPRLLELMAARSRAFDMAGGILSQLPILAHIAPRWSGYELICSLNNELKALLEKTIAEHKEGLDPRKDGDFIDTYLKEIRSATDSTGTFTEEQLVMVCLDFFIAGSQTTSNTLGFALLNMMINKDIQAQAYEEILGVLGDRKLPSLEDRERLPFVEAVLLESQRLMHVVPVAGPRRVLRDTSLGGYHIPKNSTVLLSLYSMHHDDDTWDDPLIFRPSRFLDKTNKVIGDDLYQFGLGRRRCPGEALARHFVFLFFTGILRSYNLEVPKGSDPPTLDPIPGITLAPKPYSVHITPRIK